MVQYELPVTYLADYAGARMIEKHLFLMHAVRASSMSTKLTILGLLGR